MGGGLMQLVAYGAQDTYLTGNPQITFWKVTYRRYTNFAVESIEQGFNGQADFGRRVQCTVSRSGDLIYRTYLQITLPSITQQHAKQARWLDFPGEQIINQVEIEIGGQRIDRQYGDWMHIWNQLTMSTEQQRGYYKMVGNTMDLTYVTHTTAEEADAIGCGAASGSTGVNKVCAPRKELPETTLYVPLQFWYCTNPGLALPLIALQYHEVKISVDLRPLDECLWAVNTDPVGGGLVKATTAYSETLKAASLFIDYIFLDSDERRRIAQNPHEYLITQLQFTGDESVASNACKIKLNFNHPVKELIWVVQADENIDYCGSFTDTGVVGKVMGAQPFNYTDSFDVLLNDMKAYGDRIAEDHFIDINGLMTTPSIDTLNKVHTHDAETNANAADVPDVTVANTTVTDTYTNVGSAAQYVMSEAALDMHCWGCNPVVTAKLQLNGQDRFSEREGSYFSWVQPFQAHTRCPDEGINVYSFAIRPEEHQPSGTCNFSRIDNATLQLVLTGATVGGTKTARVRIYATNYNVLRIMSGMGGLAYSN
jgi:hypothetical protein